MVILPQLLFMNDFSHRWSHCPFMLAKHVLLYIYVIYLQMKSEFTLYTQNKSHFEISQLHCPLPIKIKLKWLEQMIYYYRSPLKAVTGCTGGRLYFNINNINST